MDKKVKAGMADKVKTFFFCLWVCVAMLLIQGAGAVLTVIPKAVELAGRYGFDIEKIRTGIGESANVSIILFFSDILCLVAALIWYYRGYVKKDKEKGVYKPLRQKIGGIKAIGFILCGCLSCWGLAVVLQKIGAILFPETAKEVNTMLNMAVDGSLVFGILAVVIIAPVFEELTVRGIVLQRAKRSFGVVGCMVISALMFGFMHLNLIQGIYVIPMGLFWGFVAYRFNSVIPCFFCHILNNLIGALLPNLIDPLIIFIVFGVLTAFIGVKLGYFNFNKEKENDDKEE